MDETHHDLPIMGGKAGHLSLEIQATIQASNKGPSVKSSPPITWHVIMLTNDSPATNDYNFMVKVE